MEDVEAVIKERPSDEVGQQERAQVADMGPAIDRRAAGVEADPPAISLADVLEREDRLDLAAQGVAQVERHPISASDPFVGGAGKRTTMLAWLRTCVR